MFSESGNAIFSSVNLVSFHNLLTIIPRERMYKRLDVYSLDCIGNMLEPRVPDNASVEFIIRVYLLISCQTS